MACRPTLASSADVAATKEPVKDKILMSQQDQTFEILKMNVDNSCDFVCEACSRYFGCTLPERVEMEDRGRMDIAAEKMSKIKNKIVVLSGKGGVGKTTTATNLAVALQIRGNRVCILDSDFDSPSVPRMMGVKDTSVRAGRNGIIPVETPYGVTAMSVGFIIDDAEVVTWFHEMRRAATEEFCANVEYGELDYLIVDLPAGTGTEAVSVMQYIQNIEGAIIVTMASDVSQASARRAGTLCMDAGVPIVGVIENMSGYICPSCGEGADVLRMGGGERLATELGVPFLGRVPIHQAVADGSDLGKPFVVSAPESEAAKVFETVVDNVEKSIKWLAGQKVKLRAAQ
jgi:ATP-binding protein involved in chromosome partitioning